MSHLSKSWPKYSEAPTRLPVSISLKDAGTRIELIKNCSARIRGRIRAGQVVLNISRGVHLAHEPLIDLRILISRAEQIIRKPLQIVDRLTPKHFHVIEGELVAGVA